MQKAIVSLVSVLVLSVSIGQGAEPEKVAPVSEQQLLFPKYERSSTSPFGSSRIGGSDTRPFRFTRDGRLIIGMDGGAWQYQRFDVASGVSIGVFGRADYSDKASAISPNGKQFIAVGQKGKVELWDLQTLREPQSLDEGVNYTEFTAAAFIDDRLCAFAGRSDRGPALCVWDIQTGDEVERYELANTPATAAAARRAAGSTVHCMAVAPGGFSFALVEGNQVVLRERNGGGLRRVLAFLPTVDGQGFRVSDAAFSLDGRYLALATSSGIFVYDVRRGAELRPLVAHEASVRALWFSPDGKQLRSLGDDQRVLTWDVADITRPVPIEEAPKSEVIETLVADAAGNDPWKRYLAVQQLLLAPGLAVEHLRKAVHPVKPLEGKDLDAILNGLVSESLRERKAAARAMKGQTDQVFAAVEELDRGRFEPGDAAARAAARERASRFRSLRFDHRERFDTEVETRELQQTQRKLTLLLQLNTPAARELVAAVAGGAPKARVTQTAQDLLKSWPEVPATNTGDASIANTVVALQSESATVAYTALTASLEQWKTTREPITKELNRLAARQDLGDARQRAIEHIKKLDSDEFRTREDASKALAELGKDIEPVLHEALESSASPETKQRIELLLKSLKPSQPLPDQRLALRLIEIILAAEGRESPSFEGVLASDANPWLKGRLHEALGKVAAMP